MTRVAPTIAAEDQLLCEACGYVLSGLPPGANCPECGLTVASSDPDLRRLPAWEDPADPRPLILRFLRTTFAVILRPRALYRHLITRHTGHSARAFAMLHWFLSSLLLGAALYLHLRWFTDLPVSAAPGHIWTLGLVGGVFSAMALTTWIAARLTHWEATYRGLRMPLPVVLRAMHYHAAHYVPVCAVALATVVVYRKLLDFGVATDLSAPTYLYVLCAEVILGAFYLFKTYWTAMRNVMYANR